MSIILDTLPLIDFLKGESKKIRDLIIKTESEKISLCISAVTISELFYILADFQGIEFSRASIENIKATTLVVNVTAEIAEKAGEFKFKYAGKGKKGLPMADAIIAASAWKENAVLITTDEHFFKIKEIRVRRP